MKKEIIKQDVPYQNQILLNGEISKPLSFLDSGFVTFGLKTKRYSSFLDELKIYLPAENLSELNLQKGCFVNIDGEIRTRNVVVDDERRLQISVLANEIKPLSEEDVNGIGFVRNSNNAYFSGSICKMLPLRKTPQGSLIQEGMVAINHREIGKSFYIPFIAWNKSAEFVNRTYKISDQVSVHGRLQSRDYVKSKEDGSSSTRTAYEVSVIRMDPFSRDK